MELEMCKHYSTRIVCGVNELPNVVGPAPAVYVVNSVRTDHQGPGHWTCFVFTTKNTCLFFDALGKSPGAYGRAFVDFVRGWEVVRANHFPIQQRGSRKCGEYCLYFIMHVAVLDYKSVLAKMVQTEESVLLPDS